MTELTEQQLRRATTLTDHRGRLVKRTYDEADVIEWLAAARAEVARDMRTKIEARAERYEVAASSALRRGTRLDSLWAHTRAARYANSARVLRALLADGGEPQPVVMPGPFESECGVRHPSDPERRCMAPAGHAGPHGDDFGPHGTWWSAVGGEPQ